MRFAIEAGMGPRPPIRKKSFQSLAGSLTCPVSALCAKKIIPENPDKLRGRHSWSTQGGNNTKQKNSLLSLCLDVKQHKESGRFHNSARADATGTGIDPHSVTAVGYGTDFLQVGQPAAAILIMGMTDVISGSRLFSTNITDTGHNIFSPFKAFFY